MGLDVYLYRYENKAESDRLEKEYEEFSEKAWESAGEYSTIPETQKEVLRQQDKGKAASLGLDDYGSDPRKEKIERDSAIDKEHYFKIGYFRSSYNDGGINKVLRNLGVPDLYDIFSPNDQYCFQPDWEDSLRICSESITLLESKPNYRCFNVSANFFGNNKCQSEKEAMEIFLKERSIVREGSEYYSNGLGHFSLKEPLNIYGIIPGVTKMFGQTPTTYIIADGENAWYITALKIVRETIEYVISQPDRNAYYLHWSS